MQIFNKIITASLLAISLAGHAIESTLEESLEAMHHQSDMGPSIPDLSVIEAVISATQALLDDPFWMTRSGVYAEALLVAVSDAIEEYSKHVLLAFSQSSLSDDEYRLAIDAAISKTFTAITQHSNSKVALINADLESLRSGLLKLKGHRPVIASINNTTRKAHSGYNLSSWLKTGLLFAATVNVGSAASIIDAAQCGWNNALARGLHDPYALGTLTFEAVKGNHLVALAAHLADGADPNFNHWTRVPLLQAALNEGHFDAARLLVSYGSNIEGIRLPHEPELFAKAVHALPSLFATTRLKYGNRAFDVAYNHSREMAATLLEREIDFLKSHGQKPDFQFYEDAIRISDHALIRKINAAGGDPSAFFLSRVTSTYSSDIVESLLCDVATLSQELSQKLIDSLAYMYLPRSAGKLWRALIRKGLPSDEEIYRRHCGGAPCGPMAFALQYHDVEFMAELLNINTLDVGNAEDRIMAYISKLPNLNASTKIGKYTAFSFIQEWLSGANILGTETCFLLAHTLLEGEIEALSLALKTPDPSYYDYSLWISDAGLLTKLNRVGSNPFYTTLDDNYFPTPFEQALVTATPLAESMLEGTKLPTDVMVRLIGFFSSATARKDPTLVARIWMGLIRMGLPTDETLYDAQCLEPCGPRAFAEKHDHHVLKTLASNTTSLIPNEKGSDGFTHFERALKLGYLRMAAYLRAGGGKTNRIVVSILTDEGMAGRMFLFALKGLKKRDVLVLALSPPHRHQFGQDGERLPQALEAFRGKEILESKHPVVKHLKELAQNAADVSDAIWISGGVDIWPRLYNHSDSGDPEDIMRDVLEFAVLDVQQRQAYLPVFGVCRGMQVINVFYGGSLHNKGQSGTNPITLVNPNGVLGSAFDSDQLEGWSGHQQSVKTLADAVEIVATTKGGIVKALQAKSSELPLMGTQFHPETEANSSEGAMAKTNSLVIERFLAMAAAAKQEQCLATNKRPGDQD